MKKSLISEKLKSGLEFPIKLFNERGKLIYFEDNVGFWKKYKYDEKGNIIYYEDSVGFWKKSKFDEKGKKIYFEDDNGYWWKREYDERGNIIYCEDSNGTIIDNRPKEVKEVTLEELEKHFNCKVKVIK